MESSCSQKVLNASETVPLSVESRPIALPCDSEQKPSIEPKREEKAVEICPLLQEMPTFLPSESSIGWFRTDSLPVSGYMASAL
jgi:hypothetical protein